MQLIPLFLIFLLSIVFGVAGVAKLLDRRGSRDALESFGVPDEISGAIAILLPVFELAIAAGLLFRFTIIASVIAAVLLLLAFIVGISYNLAQGRAPECHCFGQLYSRPL